MGSECPCPTSFRWQKVNRKEIVNKETGAQWLSGRVLALRPRGCGFKPHGRHCVVSLSKNIKNSK